MITPVQCLEARKLLKWSRDRMAAQSGMPAERLRHFEIGRRELSPGDLAAIQRTLEEQGIEFTSGEEPGVRLKSRG